MEKTRKQKENCGQKNMKSRITLSGVLVWIAKLLCILITGIVLLLAAKLILCSTITMSTEEKVIDIGLAIIGLAIAILAGLNIPLKEKNWRNYEPELTVSKS